METKTKTGFFRVRHPDVGANGLLRPDVLFDYMQELAGDHAEELGFGYNALREKQLTWILSRLCLSIERFPAYGEEVRIQTWPSGVDSLFATREFVFKCAKDTHSEPETIARASSCWLVFHTERMRPVRVSSLGVDLSAYSDQPRFFPGLGKMVRQEVSHPLTVRVMETMIDLNDHVNNARYIGLVYDWLADRLGKIPQMKSLHVNYVAATQRGAFLTTAGSIEGQRFYVESSEENSLHFQAEGGLV
ncbi:MAG: hypothetical protein IJU47_00880 [Verrucomicrobia bacterium]|nr:hypothetical protein [Verrucomicrobiota bacterium]